MFRLFFEVGLFNLAEKTGCSCYQWNVQLIQVPYHNKPELNRIFPESVPWHAWLRWIFIQCRHVFSRCMTALPCTSAPSFWVCFIRPVFFSDVIFVGSNLQAWLPWTKKIRSAWQLADCGSRNTLRMFLQHWRKHLLLQGIFSVSAFIVSVIYLSRQKQTWNLLDISPINLGKSPTTPRINEFVPRSWITAEGVLSLDKVSLKGS